MTTKLVTRASLVEDRRAIQGKMAEVYKNAEASGRSLVPDEQSFVDSMAMESERLARSIERQEQLDDLNKPSPRLTRAAQPIDANGNPQRSSVSLDSEWRDRSGRRIPVLGKEQRMADLCRDARFDSMSFGRTIKGIITGNWSDATLEQRTMSGFQAIAGGYLVPSPLSAEVIDYARNASVCFSAGARTIPMTSDTLDIARQTADPAMEVHTENAAFTARDVNFDRIHLVARTIGTIVKASRELAEDAPNFPELITRTISNALAAEIDKQCLVGAFPGMAGLQSVGGINTVTSVGTPTTWAKWAEGIGECWIDNGKPNAFVVTGATAKRMAGFADSTTQPLQMPPALAALQMFVTNSLPTTDSDGAGASSYIGDFTEMMIGVRSDIMVEVTSTGGDSFENHQVWLKVTWRGDMSVEHPNHFCRLSGIT